MFLHGLESGPNGLKATILREAYRDFCCPHIQNPKNIWSAFTTVRREIRLFRPDIVVASSYGSILLMLLIQLGIWTGPSIILACALAEVAKHRMYLPDKQQNMVIVHGIQDTVCDIAPVKKMADLYGIEMIELDDTHSLKSLCQEDKKLVGLIDRVMEDRMDGLSAYERFDFVDGHSDAYYWGQLTLIVIWAMIRWPFNRLF